MNGQFDGDSHVRRNERGDKTPLVFDARPFSNLMSCFGVAAGSGSGSGSSRFGDSMPASSYVEFDHGAVVDRDDSETLTNGRTLNTFSGVFTPVTLSMFSALIFLRVGYLIGNAGLYVTAAQFAISYLILLFTVLSVCAISTNGAVEGGGAYFMISRTLGPDFGGSIGTLFFLANIVNCALCISGCTESLVENFGPSGFLVNDAILSDGKIYRLFYCTILNAINLVICLFGSKMFAKTNILVFGIVLVSVCSVLFSFLFKNRTQIPIPKTNTLVQNDTYEWYTGFSMETFESNLHANYSRDYTTASSAQTDFASVFGVLFSGVTGILAGANMSGELRNPGRNIPRGTLYALFFTLLVYLLLSLLSAATCSRLLLQNHYLFMQSVNFWPFLVAVGVFTATMSASLSNLIGCSRVLEALAKDKIFGATFDLVHRFKYGSNPIGAVIFSWFLVQIILLIGAMNTIAQLNTVLFLLSYFAINLACLGLELASAPNFRPSFKYFTWHTASAGLIGSLIMMFVTNSVIAACAIVLCMTLVLFLHFFSPSKQMTHWGHISQALIFHQVRKYLLMLDSRKDHVKFWRPQILLMVANPRFSCPLIDFINDLKKGGLYLLGHVKIVIEGVNVDADGEELEEDGDEMWQESDRTVTGLAVTESSRRNVDIDPAIRDYTDWLAFVDHLKVKAFVELTVSKRVRDGFQHLARLSGIGAMKPNTIVFGFKDEQLAPDFLSDPQSPYRMNDADNDSVTFPCAKSKSSLDAFEYVSMIRDTLRMNKNICICRNFNKMDKLSVSRNYNLQYIDVWPLNFFEPSVNDPFDTTSLFMMQMACIVTMVPVWKRFRLRICLCDCVNSTSFSTNDPVTFSPSSLSPSTETKLANLLNTLRIDAKIYPVHEWSTVIDSLTGSAVNFNQPLASSGSTTNPPTQLFDESNQNYLDNVNNLIVQNSNQTAVTFIYLPNVPKMTSRNNLLKRRLYENYLQMLTKISDSLPSTIFVHGVSTVTSTDL